MPQYLTMMKMTPRGRVELTGSLDRGQAINAALSRIGVTSLDYFITLGAYDCVMLFDAPDESVMGHALMIIGTFGAVETNTMAVVSKEAYARILDDIAGRGGE
jgi:uncharacterized protein with GYD domain